METAEVRVNRAPVLTLWAAVVAERMGFAPEAALTLGRAVAGFAAQAKGRSLGIFEAPAKVETGPPREQGRGEDFWVELCGRRVPVKNTTEGVRAVTGDRPLEPAAVQRYLRGKFGDHLPAVREALQELAQRYPPQDLNELAFSLYEQFRPAIAAGKRGWGQAGVLNLNLIRSLGRA